MGTHTTRTLNMTHNRAPTRTHSHTDDLQHTHTHTTLKASVLFMYTTLFLSLDWQHLLLTATFVSHTHIHTHTYTHTHWFVHLCLVLRMALGDGLREPVKNHRGRGRMDISGTVLAQPCTPGWVCEHSICLCPLSELSLCQAGSGIRR